MTARTATTRLYVTAAQLLTLAMSLLCVLIRLLVALATLGASGVERLATAAKRTRPSTLGECMDRDETRRASVHLDAAPTAPVDNGLVAASGLVKMGFRRADVDRWRAGLGERGRASSVEALVKEGLKALAS
jgi:hypothetical protein